MIRTSHIGSLPFKNTKDADQFNSCFDLPVLYTMPLLDNNQFMIEQVVGDCKIYSEEILQTNINVYNLKVVQNFTCFKYQMAGPITLIKSLNLTDEKNIDDFLNWYQKQLMNLFSPNILKKCYFFLDEPMLFMASENDYKLLNEFLCKIETVFYKIGVHCCCDIKPNLLNFEVLNGLSIESKYLTNLDIKDDFDLFLGVLDTKTIELDPIVNLKQFRGDVYVTPHCGLAFTDIEKMQLVSKNLTKWANMAQAR